MNINGQPAALQKDGRFCKGALPDTLIAGASTVRINSRLVVPSMRSVSLHGAVFVTGSLNVMVGGPLMVGDAAYWKDICQKMCTTREPNLGKVDELQKAPKDQREALKRPIPRSYSPGQSTMKNCGCEVARQVIWGYGLAEPTEEDVLIDAVEKQRAEAAPGRRGTPVEDWLYAGGTRSETRKQIVQDWGNSEAPAMESVAATKSAVVDALKSGNPVILPVMNSAGKHVVLATGVELDDQGNPVAIYVNDTDANAGGCGQRIPISSLSLDSSDNPVVVGGRSTKSGQ